MEYASLTKRDWATSAMSGTCSNMCPDAEVAERREINQLHLLERNPLDPSDTSLMMKKYFRTMTDQTRQMRYMRDRVGIAKSMDRLRVVMDRKDVPFETRASFIWDRYRAIWKDMSIQNWQDIFRVSVLEEIVRFMIFADFEVARQNAQTNSLQYQDVYNSELGIQLLLQCFVTLSDLYETLRKHGEPCPNEFEFRVYHLLLQMTPVEGRNMEHGEIEGVFRMFPRELVVEHSEKLQKLNLLYEAMKHEKWDQIIDLVWQMDFFEFALGRRILERFREIRFIKFFKKLKRLNKQATHPPMPLHEFCDRFFLDSESGLQFAKAYGMNFWTDFNDQTFIIIHEGYRRPKKAEIPAIGVGLPPWGFMNGEIEISDFVIQRPTTPHNAVFNFTVQQLVWPSYTETMKEWRSLERTYHISEFWAALLQRSFWQKFMRLEVLNEIPQETYKDAEGNWVPILFLLPFFRTLFIEPTLSEPVEVKELEESDSTDPDIGERSSKADEIEEGELVEEIKPTDERIETNVPNDRGTETEAISKPQDLETQSNEDPIPEGRMNAPETSHSQLIERQASSTVHVQAQSDSPKRDDVPESSSGVREVSEEVHEDTRPSIETEDEPQPSEPIPPPPGSGWTHRVTLNRDLFNQLVLNGKRKRGEEEERARIEALEQTVEARPEVIPFLTPMKEELNVPEDATERWLEHCHKYFGGEEASDNTLLELELKFYEEYAQRYDRMKKLETTIPLGWRIHPKRQRQLLDINRPWVDPPIVPCDFPPRLTDDHLLEMLEDHASVHRPFLTHSLAKRIAENAPEAYRHCNFVFLHEGPLDPTNFTQKWFGHRFFNNLERNEVSGMTRFLGDDSRELTYCCHKCDLNDISEENEHRIRNASALFLLLDDPSNVETSIQRVNEFMSLCEDGQKPSLVVFDALIPLEGLIHEDAIILDDIEIDEWTDMLENPYLEDVDVTIIPVMNHLEMVTRSIFRYLSDRWKPYVANHFKVNPKIAIKADSVFEEHYDPIEHGLECIWMGLSVKEESNSEEIRRFFTKEAEEERVQKWEREWEKMNRYGAIVGAKTPEELYHAIELNYAIAHMEKRPPSPIRRPRRRARSASPVRSRAIKRSRSRERRRRTPSLNRFNQDYVSRQQRSQRTP